MSVIRNEIGPLGGLRARASIVLFCGALNAPEARTFGQICPAKPSPTLRCEANHCAALPPPAWGDYPRTRVAALARDARTGNDFYDFCSDKKAGFSTYSRTRGAKSQGVQSLRFRIATAGPSAHSMPKELGPTGHRRCTLLAAFWSCGRTTQITFNPHIYDT